MISLLKTNDERIENSMTDINEFEFIADRLFENAVKEFKTTEQYKLMQEKVDQMNRDCDTMFTKDEKHFALECFELVSDIDKQEKYYVYRKGLLDSIKILKLLEVIV